MTSELDEPSGRGCADENDLARRGDCSAGLGATYRSLLAVVHLPRRQIHLVGADFLVVDVDDIRTRRILV